MVSAQIQILNTANLAEEHGKSIEKQMGKASFCFMKKFLAMVKKKLSVTDVNKMRADLS